MRRLFVALVLAAPMLVGVGAAPAKADPISSCTPTVGTIVAVNFAHWGGPIVRGCGANDATGYDLLHAAGFTTAGDDHDGPAFICRLGNAAFAGGMQYPTPKTDACVVTPPASAYWSHWLAAPGATTWHYSDFGAMGEKPVPGAVELWEFGGTNIAGTSGTGVPPNSLIAQLRATGGTGATSPKPPARTTAPPARGAPAGGGSEKTGASGLPAAGVGSDGAADSPGGAPGTDGDTSAGAAASSAPPSPSPTATATPAPRGGEEPAGATIVAARTTPKVKHSSGSALPLVITVAIVAVLGGVGCGGAFLRRQRAAGD